MEFKRPDRTPKKESILLPSDESLGYCQMSLGDKAPEGTHEIDSSGDPS